MTVITQELRDLALLRAFELEAETGDGINTDYQRLLELGWVTTRPTDPGTYTEYALLYEMTEAGKSAAKLVTEEDFVAIDDLATDVLGWQ